MSAGSVFDVQGGMIELSTANWSSNNLSSLNVASGARFAAVNVNVFVDALTGAGQIDSGLNNNEIFTFGVNNGSGTFTGNLTDTTAGVYRGAFTKAGTGTQILTGNNTYTRGTTISGGTLQLGDGGSTGSLSTSSAIVNNGTLSINRSNSVTQGTDFSGAAITGTGSFIQAGTGTTTLNAANTYSGTTTVSAGTLIASNANALGASTGNITASGGTLNLGGNSFLRTGLVRFSGGTVSNGTITNNTTAFDAQSGNISAILAGSAGLAKSSNGTLSLSGINTYTGATTISSGTLQLGDGNATGSLSASSAITNNGTLSINRSNAVTQGTDFSSAAMTGTGSFIQAGSGTTTLNAANTYSGTTTVSAGTLALGSGGSIASGSVLTIAAGAIFDVTAKSSFTIINPLTIEVGETNAGSLNAAGISLTYGDNLTLNITTSTPLSTYNLFGFGSETGTFASVSLSGAYSGALIGSGDVWSLTSDGNIWTFTESTGVLAVSAVPEPGTWALVGVSLSALLLFRRRKNEVG
jgi:autotransporter-associated beta strand protein